MAKSISFNLHFILSLLLLYFSLIQGSGNPDFEALMAFKSGSDRSNRLVTWNSTAGADPCTWAGVSCLYNRVSKLVLENLDLHASFQPLTSLTQLRVLSLKQNRLSGPIPALSNLTSLKLLFLSHNEFSGEFPASATSLVRLYRLDLSYNNISGEIPSSVNHLTRLLTLRLSDNNFSGTIPVLNLPDLQDFNVSGNHLSGQIPNPLSSFPESSFALNPNLCGAPMKTCDPPKPGPEGAIASPLSIVSSSPSSIPINKSPIQSSNTRHTGTPKLTKLKLLLIILGNLFILIIISIFIYYCFYKSYAAKLLNKNRSSNHQIETQKIIYTSNPYPAQLGFEKGQMVFFAGAKRFELEDLLRASAEMLGKGGFGTAYKAVLEDGSVVVVKRFKDAQIGGRKEFEQQMEVLGKLRHENVLSLKAYYFAREEKLLVHDYMPNGSLFWLLHGNRGPGRTPLDWTTRLKIAAGAAHGLAFIHKSSKSLKLTHGNIKSTNILIDKSGNPRISDFGLSLFSTSATAPRSNGYRAPEFIDGRKVTQKSDVYSFGVLLLEILTGKCPTAVDLGGYGGGGIDLPKWVQSVVREEWTAEVFDLELMRYKDIEEEMVSLLQIAMACTAVLPDQRPRMSHVVKMIDELRGVEGSPSHYTSDSLSDSPAVSEG